MSKWRPMSTIPTDKTKVLVRAPGDEWQIRVAWMNQHGVLIFNNSYTSDIEGRYTGWMPLPDIED